ncbi:zinc-dependent metalloprotease [Dyadobacter sp. CY312]|uniref:zinc-dependent metalloprotease n=1 Tax=Dyadobacter sp. CY312 TaxID=2907303 RepID=UPI001F1E880C|nr:zinc-dependent metalloprotease [Dyadobacter sp. CY312]MCE7041631.1 zinc-dependent metalloprotease [Dyadobacter sp. CY312]
MNINYKFLAVLIAAGNIGYAQSQSGSTGNVKSQSTSVASIASVTENLKKHEGFFNFYYDEKTGKVLLEIDKMDQEFLYFSSLSNGVGNGGPERGQASSAIAKFVKVGAKVLLIEPVYNYRAITENRDEIKSVESSFAKSVIWGFTPVATDGNKTLIDLTPFIVRDSQNMAARLGVRGSLGPVSVQPVSNGGTYRMDDSRSVVYIENTKNFPKNTEFEALITFTGGAPGGGRGPGLAPDPGAVSVNMHQSFVELPDANYKSRRFDARSGFGMFSYMDFSAPMTEPIVKRFIRRHRLEKKNPGAAVSEAVKPIVYYIDRGAPGPVKKALIDGGAYWNESFEAAGFKNAFIVKELPEGVDPMDIRYNVVNWINRSGSPRGFSFGSSFIDPRTGEIMKGVVTLGSDRHRQDYLIAEGLLQPYEEGKPVPKEMEELALARIRQLSAHEIGHTLGFNHNFAASPKDRGSVMDYPFPRFSLKPDGKIEISDSYGKGIGSWDTRAVMWGYTEFPKGADEEAGLEKIMQETLKQGHIYIPDIGGNAHPTSHQWDDGSNPIDQMTNIMAVRKKILDNFSEKAIRDGEPMATLEEVLVPMYLLHRYQIEAVAKSVGGLYFTHAVKNDGQVVTRMVEPKEQWRALESLLGTITPEALALPQGLIQKIPPRPSGYPAGLETFTSRTGPTFDPVAAAETAAGTTLSYLLDSQRAARLIEYNARDSKQPGFMPVVDRILEKTWKAPLQTGYKGELHTLVNNLSLKYLLRLAADTKAPESVRGEALLKVDELEKWMKGKVANAGAKQKANILFGLSQIEEFSKNPEKFQPASPLDMPPGAPIMGNMDFLNCSGGLSEWK